MYTFPIGIQPGTNVILILISFIVKKHVVLQKSYLSPSFMPFWFVTDAIMSFLLGFTVLSCKHKMVIIALPLPERLPMRSLLYSCHLSTKSQAHLFFPSAGRHIRALTFSHFFRFTHTCVTTGLPCHYRTINFEQNTWEVETEEKCINAKVMLVCSHQSNTKI